jgi:putative ABC transport system permease protein
MSTFWQDLRYGIRMLRKSIGFTLAAVLTLALGIGANTAIFSVVNAVLLRPLPYPQPDQIVRVFETNRTMVESPTSPPNFLDWREQNHVFERVAAFQSMVFNVVSPDGVEQLSGMRVSADFFPLLRVTPALGRSFLPNEDAPAGDRVVMLSHGFWVARFGGDSSLVGKTVTLGEQTFTVVGVLPPDFEFLSRQIPLWTPLRLGDASHRMRRGERYLQAIARLRPGVTLQQAQTEMNSIALNLGRQHPTTNTSYGVRLVDLHEHTVGNLRTTLTVLLAAAGFVLLIAFANVANLLLVRSATRQREMAIRSSLGASRWRVIRQLLAESALLFVLGGAAALLLASWSLDLLIRLWPQGDGASTIAVARLESAAVDGRVLLFTLAVSLPGMICGLAPAWQSARLNLNEILKEGISVTANLFGLRLRRALVTAEVALALVLMVGAGLLVNSLWRLYHVDPGFDPEHVVTMQVTAPPFPAGAEWGRNVAGFFRDVVSHIESVPGVRSVSVINTGPMTGEGALTRFTIENRPPASLADVPMVNYRVIGPQYFRVMDIRLQQGRQFTSADQPESLPAVVVNETLARRFWPNESPVGRRIRRGGIDGFGPWYTVVGVTADVRSFGLDAPARPELYFAHTQFAWPEMTLVARTAGEPLQFLDELRAGIRAIDKRAPFVGVRTMEQLLSRSVAPRRFNMALLVTFAGIALMLAAVGTYGVVSYSISQRTREIGIRIALGARRHDLFGLVLKEGMSLALAGILIGVLGALAVTRVLSTFVFGVTPTDPVTFILVSVFLGAVAFLASYIPARRAAKVDPIVALRYE